jgi:hypothetical protein
VKTHINKERNKFGYNNQKSSFTPNSQTGTMTARQSDMNKNVGNINKSKEKINELRMAGKFSFARRWDIFQGTVRRNKQ